jgi:hypothetical protein
MLDGEPIVVRMIARSPRDRMQPGKPERFALECGYPGATAETRAIPGGAREEKGRMVEVRLERESEIPEALHLLADLWGRQVRVQKNLRGTGAVRVVFDIVDGGRGEYGVLAEELTDWLHIMAEQWGARRAVRRALFRKSMPAPGVSTRQ